MAKSRTLDEIKASLTQLPRPPIADSQAIVTDDLRRILDRSDKTRERTETLSGALLAGLTAIATFAASRIEVAAIDSDTDRVLVWGMVDLWLLSVLCVVGVIWRGRHALGWDPESMVGSSSLEPLDVRQQRIVELAIAVISSNRLAIRKGTQFNPAVGPARVRAAEVLAATQAAEVLAAPQAAEVLAVPPEAAARAGLAEAPVVGTPAATTRRRQQRFTRGTAAQGFGASRPRPGRGRGRVRRRVTLGDAD